MNLSCVLRSQVKGVEQAAVFKHDGILAEAGPFDVVLGEGSELAIFLRAEVVAVEIHCAVEIRDEINRVSMPHGEKIHALGVRQFGVGVIFQIVDADWRFPAAAISLPGAEVLRSGQIRDAVAVGGKAGEARARNS